MKAIEQAKKIYEFCAPAAKNGTRITYREVLEKLGYGPNVSGNAIRYGLELAWIACVDAGVPSLTAIIVNRSSGRPSEGYSATDPKKDAMAVFAYKHWPPVDSIDWEYIWQNRAALSKKYGTRGYWTRT